MGNDHSIYPLSIGTFRFASIALSRNYVTPEQVYAAIAELEEEYITGRPQRFLGEVFLENHLISEDQMESILEEMGRMMDRLDFYGPEKY